MNKEQPIAMPSNLEEDWRLAELTEATVEVSPEIRDEWRQVAVPVPELFAPMRLLRRSSKAPEPALSDMQQTLFAAIAARPKEFDLGSIEVQDSAYTLSMLRYNFSDKRLVEMAHWARQVGFMLSGGKSSQAGRILRNYYATLSFGEEWAAAAKEAVARLDHDEVWQMRLDEITQLIAPIERDQKILREIIALTVAQVEHWQEVQSARRTRNFVARLDREQSTVDPEPSPVIERRATTPYEAHDLVQLPIEQIIDIETGALTDPEVVESELSPRGELIYDAMRLWPMMRLIASSDCTATTQTRTMMNRIGFQGDERVAEAGWIRHIIFRKAGVRFEHAIDAHQLYTKHHQMPAPKWIYHTVQLRRQLVHQNPDLDKLVDDCMQLAGIPDVSRELCRRMAALSLAELEHWQRLTEFDAYVKATFADEQWLDALRTELHKPEKESPSEINEPGFKIEKKTIVHRYGQSELVELPIDSIMTAEMYEYRDTVRYAAEVRRRADKQLEGYRYYLNYTEKLARKLINEVDPDDKILVHHARFLAFDIAGLNYNRNHWTIHNHSKVMNLPSDELIEQSTRAIQDIYAVPILARKIEACLPTFAQTDGEKRLARHIICLTLEQIRKWRVSERDPEGEMWIWWQD